MSDDLPVIYERVTWSLSCKGPDLSSLSGFRCRQLISTGITRKVALLFSRSPLNIAIMPLDPSKEVQMVSQTIQRIAQLNDAFRKGDSCVPGQRFVTAGVFHMLQQLDIAVEQLIQRVAQFDDFNEHNDPHAQHDFGAFEHHGHQPFWKLDAYDVDYNMGSDDPTDLSKTRRVLTIMLSHEW